MPTKSNSLVALIDKKIDLSRFREQHWEGTFWEYLDIVHETPIVSRNAFQPRLRHDPDLRERVVHAVQAGIHLIQIFRRPDRSWRRCDLRP